MFSHRRWVILAAFYSFSACANDGQVSSISEKITYNISDVKAALQKEVVGNSLKVRAGLEAKSTAQKIRLQISNVYQVAIKEGKSSEEAAAEIKEIIEQDIASGVDPRIQTEIRTLALDALEEIQFGKIDLKMEFKNLKKAQEKSSKDITTNQSDDPGSLISSEAVSYTNKEELLASLTSSGDSTRWTQAGNMSMNGAKIVKNEARISMQIKADVMGVTIEAGPYIKFTREYGVRAVFMSEGMKPSVLPDGNLDFYKRDRSGNIILINGVKARRHIAFICDADLTFEAELGAGGALRFAGAGVEGAVIQKEINTVNIASRRIQIPQYIGGKSVTTQTIYELCHNDYLSAKVSDKLTVKDSLNMMMNNFIANLRYSNSKMKCAIDSHCQGWLNAEVKPVSGENSYGRCVPEAVSSPDREGFKMCVARGLKYQSCTVFDAQGKRTSKGWFEYTCDEGLKCVTVQKPGFMKYAIGQCMPVDAKTYKDPRHRPISVKVVD